jgi:hypothetical protein
VWLSAQAPESNFTGVSDLIIGNVIELKPHRLPFPKVSLTKSTYLLTPWSSW